MDNSNEPSRMTKKALLIVLVVSFGSFMAGLDATIVNIALPSIAKGFDIPTVHASWVLNAYLIILVSLLLAASKIGDMKGYKEVFLTGFGIFTIGSALCGTAPTIDLLIFFRMIQAVGGAIIAALGAVMVTAYLGSQVRGQALGLVAMFTMLGVALGPVIGGFLTSMFSWRFIFYVNIPVGLLAIILGIICIPLLKPVTPSAKLDIPGILFLFIALTSLIFGLNTITGPEGKTAGFALIGSVIFTAIFIYRQKSATEPLINLAIFKKRAYSFQNIDILILQLGLAGVMFLMPFYLEIIKDLPSGTAGALLLALPIGNILTGPISGKISDVIGTKKPIIIGFVISIGAMALLSTLSGTSHPYEVVMYLFILGAGAGIAYAPLNSAIMGESPEKERGVTSGLLKMMTNLGSSLGVALTLLISGFVMGPKMAMVSAHSLPPVELIPAFQSAFLFCMVLLIAGLILIMLVKENKQASGLYEPGV